jgi:EmrB/QacA subfamily drug resistance transporter
MFASAIEMTIVSTAMARASGELGGSDRYAWVISIYLLTNTISAPLFGKFADLLGRRPAYLVGMGLFLLGSWCSGAAWSMTALIVARAVQGVGGGGIATVALTIVGDLYPAEQRAKVQGLFSAVWGLAGAIGPVAGGLIVDLLSWRWVFYLNLPFGIVAMALLAWSLSESVVRKEKVSVDWAGAIALTVAVVLLQIGSEGSFRALGRWPMLASTAVFAAFIAIERRARQPILPLALFSNRTIAVAVAIASVSGVVMTIITNYIPLFVQGAQGMSTRSTGLALTPFALGWPIGAFAVGTRLVKVGYRRAAIAGFMLVVLGCLLLTQIELNVAIWQIAVGTGLIGLGMGIQNTPLLIVVQSLAPWEQRGAATAAFNFSRTLGGTLGAVIAGSIATIVVSRAGVGHDAIDAALRPHAPVGDLRVRITLAAATQLVLIANVSLAMLGLLGSLALPKMAAVAFSTAVKTADPAQTT